MLAGQGRWDVEKAGLPGKEMQFRAFGTACTRAAVPAAAQAGLWAVPASAPGGLALAGQAGRALAARAPAPAPDLRRAERCLAG